MTQRGQLAPAEVERLAAAQREDDEAQLVRQRYRGVVVEMIHRSSYREVARLTSLSTNTLQRWVREVGK